MGPAPPAAPASRVMFVTIGQAPRDDVVPEMLLLSGVVPGGVECHQAGALDGLSATDIAAHPIAAREARLYTRLATGEHVVVGAGLVARRLEALLHRLDGGGYHLIVLITTGVFQPFRLRTPFIHGQQAMDAWIATLVMGDCELGLVYPLAQQHRPFAHGTLIQNARAVAASGEAARLELVAEHLARAQLILMHSVGYTEAMAHQMAAQTRRPVVTARRVIAGALRLHLPGARPVRQAVPLMDRLPGAPGLLTPRERDVLAAVLEGEANKEIGRRLGISHRTVEIHRARALAKLGAAAPIELLRRALITGTG